eukprot:1156385-Pelagomonas_calceolata.AAC.7
MTIKVTALSSSDSTDDSKGNLQKGTNAIAVASRDTVLTVDEDTSVQCWTKRVRQRVPKNA